MTIQQTIEGLRSRGIDGLHAAEPNLRSARGHLSVLDHHMTHSDIHHHVSGKHDQAVAHEEQASEAREALLAEVMQAGIAFWNAATRRDKPSTN